MNVTTVPTPTPTIPAPDPVPGKPLPDPVAIAYNCRLQAERCVHLATATDGRSAMGPPPNLPYLFQQMQYWFEQAAEFAGQFKPAVVAGANGHVSMAEVEAADKLANSPPSPISAEPIPEPPAPPVPPKIEEPASTQPPAVPTSKKGGR